MRRRIPWWVLALLFVVVPVLEIYVLIQVGQVIGAWWTILLLLADGFLGSWLMKREGSRAWKSLRQTLDARRMPARELADGALILVGGTLLLTPGFLSDVVGFFFVLPFTRPIARRGLTRFLTRKFLSGPGIPGYLGGPGATSTDGFSDRFPGADPFSGARESRTRQRPGPDSVVQGEVVD